MLEAHALESETPLSLRRETGTGDPTSLTHLTNELGSLGMIYER